MYRQHEYGWPWIPCVTRINHIYDSTYICTIYRNKINKWSMFSRAGHIALWNCSIALRSWANLDFGANERFKKKIKERQANWQNQILSGSLVSDIRRNSRWILRAISNCNNGWKTHKKARFVHILIKNDAKQLPMVVFSIFCLCFISCMYLDSVKEMLPGGGGLPLPLLVAFRLHYTYICNWHWVGGRGRRVQILKRANQCSFRSDRAF